VSADLNTIHDMKPKIRNRLTVEVREYDRCVGMIGVMRAETGNVTVPCNNRRGEFERCVRSDGAIRTDAENLMTMFRRFDGDRHS